MFMNLITFAYFSLLNDKKVQKSFGPRTYLVHEEPFLDTFQLHVHDSSLTDTTVHRDYVYLMIFNKDETR